MAGITFRGNPGQIACVAATAKTLLQLIAAANHRIKNVYFSISFEGTSATDAPAQVRVLKQTTAGTVTGLTLIKDDDTQDETLQTTAGHSASAEPTASDVKYTQFVHPQGGAREIGPFTIPGGERLGIEVTVAANVDAIVSVRGEE